MTPYTIHKHTNFSFLLNLKTYTKNDIFQYPKFRVVQYVPDDIWNIPIFRNIPKNGVWVCPGYFLEYSKNHHIPNCRNVGMSQIKFGIFWDIP